MRGLKILQLPHSKTLKQVIKDGSENDGIDEEYLLGQQKTYATFQKDREEEGHPRPLGLGVLMWDEVKVRANITNNFSFHNSHSMDKGGNNTDIDFFFGIM